MFGMCFKRVRHGLVMVMMMMIVMNSRDEYHDDDDDHGDAVTDLLVFCQTSSNIKFVEAISSKILQL